MWNRLIKAWENWVWEFRRARALRAAAKLPNYILIAEYHRRVPQALRTRKPRPGKTL